MLWIAIAFLSVRGAVFLIGDDALRIDDRQNIQAAGSRLRSGAGCGSGGTRIQSIDLVGPTPAVRTVSGTGRQGRGGDAAAVRCARS